MLNKVFKHPILRLYFECEDVRVHISLLFSLTFSGLYSAFNALLCVLYSDLWYGTVAIYYLVLVGIRSTLFYANKRKYNSKYTKAKKNEFRPLGIAMLALNASMMSIIIYNLNSGEVKERPIVVIVVLSVYSSVMLIVSLISLIRGERGEYSASYMTARTISFSASFISLFNLWDSLSFFFRADEMDYSGGFILSLILTAFFLNLGVITGCIFPDRSYNENSGKNR